MRRIPRLAYWKGQGGRTGSSLGAERVNSAGSHSMEILARPTYPSGETQERGLKKRQQRTKLEMVTFGMAGGARSSSIKGDNRETSRVIPNGNDGGTTNSSSPTPPETGSAERYCYRIRGEGEGGGDKDITWSKKNLSEAGGPQIHISCRKEGRRE